MDEGEPTLDERASPEESSSSPRGIFGRLRRVSKRVVLRSAIGVALLIGVVWVALFLGVGLRFAVPYALDRAVPDGWTAEVGSVEGSWLRGIRLSGLTLEGPSLAVAVERLSIRYRLRPLLDRTIDIVELVVERPTIRVTAMDSVSRMEEPPDSGRDGPFPVATMLAGQPVGGWSVGLGSTRVIDAHVEVRADDGDGRYTLAGLRMAARGGLDERGLTVVVDTLRADFVSVLEVGPDSVFRSAGSIALAGELADGSLRLDTLGLTSDHSRVSGGGHVVFDVRPELWDGVDLELVADPLDVRDLPLTPPGALHGDPQARLSVRATGDPDSLLVLFDGDGISGRTSANGRVVLRAVGPEAERPRSDSGPATRPALQGDLTFEAFDMSDWTPPPFDGTLSGEVTFALEQLAGRAAFSGEGSVRHDPTVVESARLASRPLRGTFELSGRLPADSTETPGGAPLEADASVALDMGPGWRSMGTVSARLDGSTATWSLDLGLDSASARGSGDVRWAGSSISGSIDRLMVDDLNLAAIDTVYPSSDITGRIAGRLRGSSLKDLRGRIDLTLGPSTVEDASVDTLVIGSDVRGRTFEGTVSGRSRRGDLETRYTVELLDSLVRLDTERLRYVRADSIPDAPPVAELAGRVSGSWVLSDVRSGSLHAVIDSARWQANRIRDAEVSARLDGERVVADVELDAVGVLPTTLTLRAHVDATGTTVQEVRGSARLSASRPHTDDSSLTDSVRVRVDATGGGHFEVEGDVGAAEGGRAIFAATVDAPRNGLEFDATAQGGFDEPLALLNGVTIDSVFAEASGRRDSTTWRGLRADLTARDTRWRDLSASRAQASFSYDSSGLRLDTLDLESNVLQAHGAGVLPLGGGGGRIEVTAQLSDLDPLRILSGRDVLEAGGGTFGATLTGSLDSLAWTSSLDVQAIVVDRIRMSGLRLSSQGVAAAPHEDFFGISSAELDLTLDRIILPHSEIGSVEVTAAGGPDSIRIETEALVDERRRGSALVHLDPRPDRRTVRIEDLRFQVDDDQWRLAEEASLIYRTGISLEPVLLRADEQELRVEGGVSEAGDLDLNARVDSLDVTTIADLVGFPRLRGWLTGRVRVQGTTSTPEAWVDVGGAFHTEGRPPGPVDIRVRANGRSVRGDVQLRDADGGVLRVAGGALLPGADDVPVDARDAPGPGDAAPVSDTTTIFGFASDSIDVAVSADSFNVGWTEALVTGDALGSIGGRLDGSLSLVGSSSDPSLEGRLAIRDGSARPTALGVSWDDVSMTIRGDGSDLVVESARVAGSSGELRVDGTIGVMGAIPIDLQVDMDEFQAIRSDAYWAVVSGTVGVGGEAMAPTLQGDVRVEALDVFLDERVRSEGLEPVTLSERDLEMLRERFGIVPERMTPEAPLSERITADLTVELGRDSWLRKRTSPEMAVPFSGTIEVTMRPGEEPSLQGSVDVIAERGFVEQFGRRFTLSEGTVTFNGPPAATRVDLEASYTIPSHDNPDQAEVMIILDVEGTQDDLSLTLSSEPQMENADIVSYIATGRPAAGSLDFGDGQESGGGLVAAGADYALGQMTGLIESAAARSVGLDVVEIRREGLRQATVVAGKYVTPRLYVGFARPVSLQDGESLASESERATELEIEYEALRWLLINIEGSGSSLRFFLRARRAY